VLRVAVTSGLKGADQLMGQIAAGGSPYHFIEVMGCPGGCIMGGGQPRSSDPDVRMKRLHGLYTEDESKTLRKSHLNPYVTELYKEYLEHPNSHISHELLHTGYVRRGIFNELTDQRFDISASVPQTKKRAAAAQGDRLLTAGPAEARPARQELESVKVLALEAENARLKGELLDVSETVDILKNVIADYSKRER